LVVQRALSVTGLLVRASLGAGGVAVLSGALVAMSGCPSGARVPAEPPSRAAAGKAAPTEFGWVVGSCLASARSDLRSGLPVAVVVVSEPQSVVQARVGDRTRSAEGCPALAHERAAINAQPDVFFYSLTGAATAPTDLGIALVEATATPEVAAGIARVDSDHDGHTEFFTACSTSEGVNLAVWRDQVYRGSPRWSAYYYLGVDLEPTCPK
jgi:hypothetical protein